MQSLLVPNPRKHAEFLMGVRATIPLVVGTIPFGIIFGAVAVASGTTPLAAAAMSALVFAGSAQFIAVELAAAGATPFIIIIAAFIVNLRHLLYSLTLAPYVRNLSQQWLVPLGFLLTDETFLVTSHRFQAAGNSPHKHYFYLGSALFMYVNWQLCTYVGIMAGSVLSNPRAWGLDFALPLTFIGMLVPLLRDRVTVLCAVVAGVSAVLFNSLPHHLGLLVATGVAILVAAMTRRLLQIQPASDERAAHD
jgi:4-azaleucine resistance transporter AzlC